MDFKGKVVLISGAGSGIGRKASLMFAERGAKVAVNDIVPDKGQETVTMIQEKNGEALFIQGDVSLIGDTERMVVETVKAFGGLHILVNNAGIVSSGKVENTSEEDFEKTIRINVKGPFFLSQYAVKEMKKHGGGVVVHVSSVAALKGIPDRCAYSLSKGALLGLAKSMAIDYVSYNIRVNVICPGTTYSQGLAERIQSSPESDTILRNMVARQPMKRLGKEEEIAFTILFASCDETSFMTGSIITIDGGATTA